jgi:hypothetical protein
MVLERHKFNLRNRLLYLFTGKIYVSGGIIPDRSKPEMPDTSVNVIPAPRRKEIRFSVPMKLPCEHKNSRGVSSLHSICIDCKAIFYDD